MKLGQRIIEIREQMGLSQAELAARAKVTHGYLTQLEKDEVENPSAVVLLRLASALYVDPWELLDAAGYTPIREVTGGFQTTKKGVIPELLKLLETFTEEEQWYALRLLEGVEKSRSG